MAAVFTAWIRFKKITAGALFWQRTSGEIVYSARSD